MARRRHINVYLERHGIIWWLLIGWWWRPLMYTFWIFYNVLFNTEVRFKKERR